MSPSVWIAYDVAVPPQAVEAIESAFNELGSLGTETNDLGNRRLDEHSTITGYFEIAPEHDEVVRAIESSLSIYGLEHLPLKWIARRVVEQEDWLAEWKRYWKPTRVGRFVIAPPWTELSSEPGEIIRIEPNMAFGTGTHETTKMCLQAIDECTGSGRSFLDVGTGTGILAIAAVRAGFVPVDACDIDEDAVQIARENAILNGAQGAIGFSTEPISDKTPRHDVVSANLTWDVIGPILPLLIKKAGSTLILSGILTEQSAVLEAELSRLGCRSTQVRRDGEWISAVIDLAS